MRPDSDYEEIVKNKPLLVFASFSDNYVREEEIDYSIREIGSRKSCGSINSFRYIFNSSARSN